jgi:hypothetical protein
VPVLLVAMVLLGLAAGIGVTVVVARFRPPPPRVVVVLVVAALFVGMALRLSAVGQLPALPAYLYFVAVGVALTLIDLDCKRLPNALVLPSYPVVLVLLAVAALGQHDGAAIVRALIGMAVLFGLYLVLALIYPAGMGFGDVKLIGYAGRGAGLGADHQPPGLAQEQHSVWPLHDRWRAGGDLRGRAAGAWVSADDHGLVLVRGDRTCPSEIVGDSN